MRRAWIPPDSRQHCRRWPRLPLSLQQYWPSGRARLAAAKWLHDATMACAEPTDSRYAPDADFTAYFTYLYRASVWWWQLILCARSSPLYWAAADLRWSGAPGNMYVRLIAGVLCSGRYAATFRASRMMPHDCATPPTQFQISAYYSPAHGFIHSRFARYIRWRRHWLRWQPAPAPASLLLECCESRARRRHCWYNACQPRTHANAVSSGRDIFVTPLIPRPFRRAPKKRRYARGAHINYAHFDALSMICFSRLRKVRRYMTLSKCFMLLLIVRRKFPADMLAQVMHWWCCWWALTISTCSPSRSNCDATAAYGDFRHAAAHAAR